MSGLPQGEKTWSSPTSFILAAVGAAVGLGNIWKFPYVVGSNGGGIFVAVYLLCILFVALPVLIGELMVGRMGHHSPPVALRRVAVEVGASPRWSALGWVGVAGSLLIATFYSVISGWTIAYVPIAVKSFGSQEGIAAPELFAEFLADPARMVVWYTAFLVMTMVIIARGLHKGIESTIRFLMPALLILLLGLTTYACVAGDLVQTLSYMFSAQFSAVTPSIVSAAVGQAFFSIGLAAGLMMTYGAYLPKDVSVARSAVIIVVADTLIALMAGFLIFPIVFANGLDPAEGPGLIFVTLPTAFVSMQGGAFFGVLFFALLAVAALTSLIGAIEPTISYTEDRWAMPRAVSCSIVGFLIWLVGLLSVFSFNLLSDFHPLAWFAAFEETTVFGLFDYLTANVMLPIGGVLLATFVGWRMPKLVLWRELAISEGVMARIWLFLIRYVAPIGIAIMFVSNLA